MSTQVSDGAEDDDSVDKEDDGAFDADVDADT
jgi:hypothetical protein